MKKLDKLKSNIKGRFKNNNKLIYSLVFLTIVGIIAGTCFMIFINENDKKMTADYLNQFFNSFNQNNLNYLDSFFNSIIGNFIYILLIYFLGISVIGIPIILFMYFMKTFTLGFTLASLVVNYKIKGLLYSFIYVFPTHIFKIIIFLILVMYALKVSSYFIYAIFNKIEINLKIIMNKYFKILLFSLIGIVILSFFETFFIPFALQKLL